MPESKAQDPAEPGALVASATAVEAELFGLESLTATLGRIELDSQEHLALAGRTLADAFACHARAVEQMRALGDAVASAHQRQRLHAAALEQNAQRLQQRSAEFAELTAELMTLGEETRTIARMLQSLLPGSDPPAEKVPADFATRLEQALTRMDASVERARLLQQLARARGIGDIAEQAETLGAQIAAAADRLRAPVASKPA